MQMQALLLDLRKEVINMKASKSRLTTRDVTGEFESHHSPSVGKIKMSSHHRSEPKPAKIRNEEYDTILATRIAEEVCQKLTNEHIIRSPDEFLRAKEDPFHRDLLKNPFPISWWCPA